MWNVYVDCVEKSDGADTIEWTGLPAFERKPKKTLKEIFSFY